MTSHLAKPTIVGGVDAFEQAALGLEAGDAVPLAVKHLQSGEDWGIQVRQPVVPNIQLGHVPQQVRLIWHHAGDFIQPDRGSRGGGKGSTPIGSGWTAQAVAFLVRQGTCLGWLLIYCAAAWVLVSFLLLGQYHIWQKLIRYKIHIILLHKQIPEFDFPNSD